MKDVTKLTLEKTIVTKDLKRYWRVTNECDFNTMSNAVFVCVPFATCFKKEPKFLKQMIFNCH